MRALAAFILAGLFAPSARAVERPTIWVQASDRDAILEKTEQHEWAARLYTELKARSDEALNLYEPDPLAYLMGLPFEEGVEGAGHPQLIRVDEDPGGSPAFAARQEIMTRLQQAIDCGVMYYLSKDKRYARFAADVLAAYIRGVDGMEPNPVHNGGLLYLTNHLKEARIYGAQIPIIYDFAQPFLRHGGKALNLATGQREAFPFEAAQKVFRIYVDLALEVGIIDCNWPVLESSSLVNNILALDDPAAWDALLPYYLTVDTPHQDSLRKVAETYRKAGGIWPESPGYGIGVGYFSTYLMTLLERRDPALKLGERYPEPAASLIRMEYLRFPNEDFMTFGDSARSYERNYETFEYAYHLARLGGHDKEADMYGGIIRDGIASGKYDRGVLRERNFSASPYYLPLQLLWQEPEVHGKFVMAALPRTDDLKFAGIYLQRNLSSENLEEDSLMSFVGAGHYIHAHATGLHMELYGKGQVLGLRAGTGIYRTDIHEKFLVLFASGNTVISNGASASSGGWVDRHINQAELVSMEPLPNQPAVSPDHSFSTTDFYDEHNLVAPATHRRTMAVVRTSPSTGYYVDVFRAKSDYEGQFHDYLYRNVGESFSLSGANGEALDFSETPHRYPDAPLVNESSRIRYNHPGWSWFEDIRTARTRGLSIQGAFIARDFGEEPLTMHVHIPNLGKREITTAMSPPSPSSHGSYREKKTPMYILRQQGEAWTRPFAAVYEPGLGEDDNGTIRSVDALTQSDVFRGLRIDSVVEGKSLTQYVLILEPGQTYENQELGLRFDGHFAIVTVSGEGESGSLYLGEGRALTFGEHHLAGGRGYLTWSE